jgi:NADH-quinone oxidoreductase subunit F
MDLHLIPGASATADERQAIDRVIGAMSDGRRDLLLPALHAAQKQAGWISKGALNYICERLVVPPAEAYGVASFYALFSLAPRPRTVVHVCDDIACRTAGAEGICRELEERLGEAGEPAVDGTATWLRSPCLGQCDRAPAALYQLAGDDRADWTLTAATADAIVAGLGSDLDFPTDRSGDPGSDLDFPIAERSDARPDIELPADRRLENRDLTPLFRRTGLENRDLTPLLRRVGRVDPRSLDDYRAHGGYAALRRALELGSERVLRDIVDSRLVGRGGAAFPTGRKWDAVARSPIRPHYLVCNADESEPGTFKDRVLLEQDPFAVIEAMTIAGYATGCERGYLYIRGEYPLATARLESAIAQTRARGLLGETVMGRDLRFDIELRRGAGAYICGEETALFNSIEGLRGEPRNKPPFPVQSGLFGKPTVVNNVETLANVLEIVRGGGPAFADVGTTGSTGTKLFCVSGCASRAGLYEASFGVTLRQVIDMAGGVRAGRTLQAVLLGGAAGVFVTPGEIDMPLTFEGTRAAGAALGSAVVMLFDETIDLGDVVLRIARFFRDESCGQCVPCRIGTIRQEEALHRLADGRPFGSAGADIALIDDVAQAMRDASICGLGHTASSAVQTAIRKFGLFAAKGA